MVCCVLTFVFNFRTRAIKHPEPCKLDILFPILITFKATIYDSICIESLHGVPKFHLQHNTSEGTQNVKRKAVEVFRYENQRYCYFKCLYVFHTYNTTAIIF